MARLNRKQLYFIAGFLAITAVYSFYNIFLVDTSYYEAIPRKIRHINRVAAILIVYGMGTYALYKFTVDWMMQIWHLVHVAGVTILLIIGLYDWGLGGISYQARNIANSVNEFLISPALFAGMGILKSRFIK
ncbi:MAG: hypothetical protein NVSMB7_04130 [Chitinophagaceae bacterium]